MALPSPPSSPSGPPSRTTRKKRTWSDSSLDDSAVHEAEPDGIPRPQRTPKRRRTSSYTYTGGWNGFARSVPASPTDIENLRLAQVKGFYLDVAKVDQRLTEINEMREWGEACRSDGESSWGDEDLARLADWDCIDLGGEQHRDTPMTQYDDCGGDEQEQEQRDTSPGDAEEQCDRYDWDAEEQRDTYEGDAEERRDACDEYAGEQSDTYDDGDAEEQVAHMHRDCDSRRRPPQESPKNCMRGGGNRWSLALLWETSRLYR